MSRSLVVVAHSVDPLVRETYKQELSGLAEICFIADCIPQDRSAILHEAQVLATFSPERELTESELQASGARFVQCLAAGRDRFRFEHFAGCVVAFNPGAAADPIAEHAVAMVLAAAKNLLLRHRQLESGEFNQSKINTRLRGGTAAIVGFGAIGSKVALLLQAFGMTIRAVNRSGETSQHVAMCVTLDQLDVALHQADVLVIAAELNAQTENAIGEAQLRLLKEDGILVNVSRAALVQQAALYAHLREHPGFRACLDVWWVEPMHAGEFKLEYPFMELPNVIGSPHNSPMVPGIFADLSRAAARNIARFLRGQTPLHVASRAR